MDNLPILGILDRPRRKLQIPLEALFMIDFPTAKHKFSFFLDRKNQKMTLDINSGSNVYSKNFHLTNLDEDSTIRSLVLGFQNNKLTLYLNCKFIGELNLEVDLSVLYTEMDDPLLKLVRLQMANIMAITILISLSCSSAKKSIRCTLI